MRIKYSYRIMFSKLLLVILLIVKVNMALADGCNTGSFVGCSSMEQGNWNTYCFNPGSSSDEPDNTNYYWDFGDGVTLIVNDDNSEICHTYTPGTYTITLIVDVYNIPKVCTLTKQIIVKEWNYSYNIISENCTETVFNLNITGNGLMWEYTNGGITQTGNSSTSITVASNTGFFILSLVGNPECIKIIRPTLYKVNYSYTTEETCDAQYINVNIGSSNSPPNYYWTFNSSINHYTSGIDSTLSYGVSTLNIYEDTCHYTQELITFAPIDYLETITPITCIDSADAEIKITIQGGAPSYSFFLEGIDTTLNVTSPIYEYAGLAPGIYNIHMNDEKGCPISTEIIIEDPLPAVAIMDTSPSICQLFPAYGAFEVANFEGGSAPYSILWESGNINLLEDSIPVGEHTLSYIITDGNGCLSFDSVSIINTERPIANFDWIDTCLYSPMSFFDLSSINYGSIINWEWDFGNNTSLDQHPTNLFQIDGNHNVTLILTSDYGCKDTIEHNVTSHPIPLAQTTVNNDCVYNELVFTDISTINSPDNITAWIYRYGDNSPLEQTQHPTHLYPLADDYTVTVIVTSNHGCIDDTTFNVTTYPIPLANFSNNSICVNTPPTIFDNLSTITYGSLISANWDFDENNITSSLPNPSHIYTSAGSFDVQLVVQSNFGCFDTIEKPVIVFPKPTNDFTSNIIEGCSPVCISFEDRTVTNSDSTINWEWNFGDGSSSYQQIPIHCFTNESNIDDISFDISLITTNNLGCKDTLILPNYITSWHNPIAEFTIEYENLDMYQPEIELMNESIGADLYYWNFGDDNSSNEYAPFHSYSDTGTYIINLMVETLNGCLDSTLNSIIIKPVISIYVPNSFTPNGDGDNDVFMFKGYGILDYDLELMIFDRWGTLIYYTTENKGWDGTYKGILSQQDAYIWKLRCKDVFGKEYLKEGHVTLIK